MNDTHDSFLKENYTILNSLGMGGYGEAFLAEEKVTKTKVVIKNVKLETMEDHSRPKELMLQEGEVLSKLSHPNIVKCITTHITKNNVYIVMEYASGGDLKLKMKQAQNNPFSEEKILNWIIQISDAVKYLHNNKIIHRDLKLNNIFLTEDEQIKLGDFGVARVFKTEDENEAQTQVGTDSYLSPEIVEGKPYGYETDNWSLGIILFELIKHRNPFASKNRFKTFNNIVNAKTPDVSGTIYSKDLTDLIPQLLKKNPTERLHLDKLIEICKNLLNKINSKKKIKFANGEYEGGMKNNKREGFGKFEYNNGDVYKGEWKNDKKNGKGILMYKCGNIYDGEWKDDFKEGEKCKFTYNNGDYYEGGYRKNLRFGKGKFHFKNGDICEGYFKDNEINGKGIKKFSNGASYDGDFKNGEITGTGIFTYTDKSKYEGEMLNGYKNGKGIFIDIFGKKKEGIWKNDEEISVH